MYRPCFLILAAFGSLGLCLPAVPKTNAIEPFQGHWIWQGNPSSRGFEIYLLQEGAKVRGVHRAYAEGGRQVDEGVSTMDELGPTLTAVADGTKATGEVRGQYWSSPGKLQMTLSSDGLSWQVTTMPEGEYSFPEKVMLTKDPSPLNNFADAPSSFNKEISSRVKLAADIHGMLAEGQYDNALAQLSKAAESFHDDYAIHEWRARIYEAMKNDKQAVAEYSQAMKRAPNLARLLTKRGLCYVKLKMSHEATADFSKSISLLEGQAKAEGTKFSAANKKLLDETYKARGKATG